MNMCVFYARLIIFTVITLDNRILYKCCYFKAAFRTSKGNKVRNR